MTDDLHDPRSWPRTMQEQLQAEIADMERNAGNNPGKYNGADWWQLTDEEQAVFAIRRARFPRMVATWHCYEAFKRIAHTDTYDDDLTRQARQEHPEWCDEGISLSEFSDFAREYAGLTFRESDAFYTKNKYWCVRMGITQFRNEPQHDHEPERPLPFTPS